MKKKLLVFMFALCCLTVAMAQNDDRPGWTHNTPKAGNNTYVYVVERGGGTTVNEAINNALLKVLRTTMMRIGAVVSWEEVNSSLQKGADWGTVAMKYNIPINKVCEYVEQKTDRGYRVAVLCQVAKSGAVYPEFDEFTACTDTKSYSDGAALLKSVFIPGLGQMGKNHVTEGVLTLAGEVVLVGGAALSYSSAQKKLAVIRDKSEAYKLEWAKSRYDVSRTINITFLSAAGALYAFNLIRAYTMAPKYKNDNLSFVPAIIPTKDGFVSGLTLTFNF